MLALVFTTVKQVAIFKTDLILFLAELEHCFLLGIFSFFI